MVPSIFFFIDWAFIPAIPILVWCKLCRDNEKHNLSHQLDAGISYHSSGRQWWRASHSMLLKQKQQSPSFNPHVSFVAHSLRSDAFQALMSCLFSHCVVKSMRCPYKHEWDVHASFNHWNIIDGMWGWFSIGYLQLRLGGLGNSESSQCDPNLAEMQQETARPGGDFICGN